MQKSEDNLKIMVQKKPQTTDLIIRARLKFQGNLENAKSMYRCDMSQVIWGFV